MDEEKPIVDRIAELERALAAAEAREREAYERAASLCESDVIEEFSGDMPDSVWQELTRDKSVATTALRGAVALTKRECAAAIRALAKERT